MITVLWRSRQIRSLRSIARLPVAGSRFASGSSNSRISTSSTSTPAMETLCFCPPESSVGALPRRALISTTSATSSTARNISSCSTQSFSSAKATSSATVRPINWPSVSCSTVPTILDIPKIPVFAGSLPPTVKVPLLSPGYEKGTIPLMQCTRVDFPDPDGPTIKTFSPGLTLRSMSRSVGSDCDRYLKV